MHAPMAHDDVAGFVVMRIALREVTQRAGQRRNDQRQQRQRCGAGRGGPVQVLAQRFEFRDVDFFDITEVRDPALGLAHALGDEPTHADDRNLFRIRAALGRRRREHAREVGALDAAAGTAAADLGEIDAGFARTAARGR